MKLFDKVKNLFTEEVEEEIRPIKKETKPTETQSTRTERSEKVEKTVEVVKEEPKPEKEEKFVFFSDEDFKDLEKPKQEPKKQPVRENQNLAYRGANPKTQKGEEKKKSFTPSLIISPVYGVLDKNYTKDEVVSKRVTPTRSYRSSSSITVDDIRNKAFGTIEDEIKDTLFRIDEIEDKYENNLDIFEELENYDDFDQFETTVVTRENSDIDEIFSELDNKKVEILDELDNKRVEILDVLDTKKSDIIIENEEKDNSRQQEEITEIDDLEETFEEKEEIDDLDLDDETLELSKQLENQKRQLDEINEYIEEPVDSELDEEKEQDGDLNESELFDLIDSMYEKRNEE